MSNIDEIDRPEDLAFLLLYHADSIEGSTRLQKLFFLLQEESELAELHDEVKVDFRGYKYGPFTEEVFDLVDFLEALGAVEVVDTDWENNHDREGVEASKYAEKKLIMTEKGQKIASELNGYLDDGTEADLDELVNRYNSMSQEDLLEYVYSQYPEYTKESEIKDEVLG